MALITQAERGLFYRLLGSLLKTGLAPAACFAELARSNQPSAMQKRLASLTKRLPAEAALTDFLRCRPFALDAAALHLLECAASVDEQCRLLEAMAIRASQQEWIDRLQGKNLFWPRFWPLVYFGTALLVASVAAIYILPALATHYYDFRMELPPATLALMKVSNWLVPYGYPILLFFVLLVLLFSIRPEFLRPILDSIRLIPPWGIYQRRNALNRYSYVLASLLSGNVSCQEAMALATVTADNDIIEARLQKTLCSSSPVPTQQTLVGQLEANPYIPGFFRTVVAVAEKTQTLDTALPELAEMAGTRLFKQTQLSRNILGVFVKITIAALVALIAFGIYQPIFQMGALV